MLSGLDAIIIYFNWVDYIEVIVPGYYNIGNKSDT